MILITGAVGKTGRELLRAFCAHDEPRRVLIRDPDQLDEMRALGASEIVVGDLQDRAALDQACREVRLVYHIPPNMHPAEVALAENLVACGEQHRVERIVYHSVLHPQVEEMPHHWEKMRVEALLFRSNLEWTILQPAVYMQNILAQWDRILEKHVYQVPYAIEAELSYIDLQDVAEIAAMCTIQTGHAFAIYELAGTAPMSQIEVAAALSEILEFEVRAEQQTIDSWREGALAAGLAEKKIQALAAMFRYYNAYGLPGNPNVSARLLGRHPTTMTEFLGRHAAAA